VTTSRTIVQPSKAPATTGSGWLLLAACAYLAFVIYGSLVPLDFQPLPLANAWAAFKDIRYLPLGVASRADWVANILLFVPLSFLWLGVLWPTRHRAARLLAAVFVVLACAALGVLIEFLQLFFPPRTVSVNDVLAETLGAGVGVAAWWLWGTQVVAWFSRWSRAHLGHDVAKQLLTAYLFLLLGYNVLPLDITINPVDLFHKWREGRVIVLPFSASFPTIAQAAYELLTDIGIWVPAAFLWRRSTGRSLGNVVSMTLLAAAGLEFVQFFIFSRVTDVTDVITAGLGGAIGGLLGKHLGRQSPRVGADSSSGRLSARSLILWLLGLALIVGALVLIFWYPFEFSTERAFVKERLAQLRRAPFTAYYYGTEFRAVTEVLHKLGFFLPLGAWLALGAGRLAARYRIAGALIHAACLLLIGAVAAMIEAGQLFLPGKNADLTDWFLEFAGGAVGYFGLRLVSPVWNSSAFASPTDGTISASHCDQADAATRSR